MDLRNIKIFGSTSLYICSSSHLLREELKNFEEVFVMKTKFPIWVIKTILKEEKKKTANR